MLHSNEYILTYQGNDKTRPHVARRVGPVTLKLAKLPLEDVHLKETRDLASIVAKHNTTN